MQKTIVLARLWKCCNAVLLTLFKRYISDKKRPVQKPIAYLALADLLLGSRVHRHVMVAGELGTHLPHKRLQGALLQPPGRYVAPVGAGVQREVNGGIYRPFTDGSDYGPDIASRESHS